MCRPHCAGEAPQIVHQGASGATRGIGCGIVKKGMWECPQCQTWWTWETRPGTITLQRRCRKCGKRVRAQLVRHWSGRGRPRGWKLIERPKHMPHYALRAECRQRNKRE